MVHVVAVAAAACSTCSISIAHVVVAAAAAAAGGVVVVHAVYYLHNVNVATILAAHDLLSSKPYANNMISPINA